VRPQTCQLPSPSAIIDADTVEEQYNDIASTAKIREGVTSPSPPVAYRSVGCADGHPVLYAGTQPRGLTVTAPPATTVSLQAFDETYVPRCPRRRCSRAGCLIPHIPASVTLTWPSFLDQPQHSDGDTTIPVRDILVIFPWLCLGSSVHII
jgi:hypothetical protein